MLTGCRVGEVVSLEWDWIKGRRIHLPDSKSGPRTVWLFSPARAVIDAIPRYSADCPFLFPARPPTRHIDYFQRHWEHIRKEAGLARISHHPLGGWIIGCELECFFLSVAFTVEPGPVGGWS